MGAINNPAIISRFGVSLSAKLKSKVFDHVGRRTAERLSDRVQVDDNGFDAIALTLNLRLQALHLVAVEGISDIPTNIDGRHCDGVDVILLLRLEGRFLEGNKGGNLNQVALVQTRHA